VPCMRTCSQVFRYSIATGRAVNDPSGAFRGALPSVKNGHSAAVTEPKTLGSLLHVLYVYEGTPVVRCVLQLAPLLLCALELRKARWSDFDLEAGEWRFKVTKTDTPHIVPLPRQAIEILRELRPAHRQRHICFSQCTKRSAANERQRDSGRDAKNEYWQR
jgi:integrase